MKETERLAVDIEETGQMLGIAPRTVWNLIQKGALRSLKVGNRRRVLVKSIHEFLETESRKVVPRHGGVDAMLAARARRAEKSERPRVVRRP